MAFTENDVDTIYETLQEPFVDLERKIVVSHMVQEAVARGFLRALEDESNIRLRSKDEEIRDLKEKLDQKDREISEMQTLLRGPQFAEGSDRSALQKVLEFLQASEKKWRENEEEIIKKERELEKLASSMVQIASLLEAEMQRAASLDKELSEVKDQEMSKTEQISSMQHEIGKLRVDNSRLKRQARLKEHQFDEDLKHVNEELQHKQIHLERVMQDRQALDIELRDKNKAFSDLEKDYQELESQIELADERVQSLSKENDGLQETIKNQEIMQELLVVCIEQQMEDNLRTYQETNKTMQSAVETYMDDMKDLVWKADTEMTIFEALFQSWYNEATNNLDTLTFQLEWKDKIIFDCDQQLENYKQAVEELEDDYATLMSVCLALLKDQNDNDMREEPPNIPTHELGRRRLMELSELLISRDVSGGQVEGGMQLEEQLDSNKSMLVSDMSGQEKSSAKVQNFGNLSIDQGVESVVELQIEEELASQHILQFLEFEIASEIVMQKYREALSLGFDLTFFPSNDYEAADNIIKKACNNFGDLEEQFESFLELEASRLQKIRLSCSTSIAKCELKLENLTRSLAHQVNETKAKISSVQQAIKELEWKHMVEEDIFLWLLCDAFVQKSQNVEDSTLHALKMEIKTSNASENLNYSVDWIETFGSPKVAVGDHLLRSDNEAKHFGHGKVLDSPSGILDKDKLILLLRTDKEDLRKEKAILEQKLDAITEEIYSLKRQFWKEKEIWVSKLSQPQRSEAEAQVEALSRQSPRCRDLEAEFNKLQMGRFEDLISDRKREWNSEKENLIRIISRKEIENNNLRMENLKLRDKEHSIIAEQADLLAEIADSKLQIDNLSNEIISKEFQFATCKELWQVEKEHVKEEVHKVLERERRRILSSHCRITELEAELQRSKMENFQLESTLMIFKKEWENDRVNLREQATKFLEKEQTRAALQGHLTTRITELEDQVKSLCQEKVLAESSLQKVQYERDILKGNVDILMQKEQQYSALEGHLLANMVGLETLLEASELRRLSEETSFLKLKQEYLSETDRLRGEMEISKMKELDYAVLEGHLLAKMVELEALLEASYLQRQTENTSFVRFKQEILSERDNLREEVENLKDREHAYAVLEGHLLASITELELLLEASHIETLNKESSFQRVKQELVSKKDDLKGEVEILTEKEHAYAVLEGHLLASIAELELLLEASHIETLNKESSFQRVKQELVGKKDDLKGEAEILKQKEHAYAVLEGHLIAAIVELETENERSRLTLYDQDTSTQHEWKTEEIRLSSKVKRFTEGVEVSTRVDKLEAKSELSMLTVLDDESLHQSMKLELETEMKRLRTEIDILSEKEHLYSLSFGHLLGEIVRQEAEVEAQRLSKLDQEFTLMKSKQEEERLLQKVDNLLEMQVAYSLSEDRLITHIKEVEDELEMLKVEMLDRESAFLRLQDEYMAEKEKFLAIALEKNELMEKLSALGEKEAKNEKIIKQLQSDKDQLAQALQQKENLKEKDTSLELARKEINDEHTRRTKLEMQTECLKMIPNNEPVDLTTRLDSLRQIESEISGQIGHILRSSQEMENKIMDMVHVGTLRLDEVKKGCQFLKSQLRSSITSEGHYKQRLAKELSNLQKAEAEVDVLGDEVECLLGILEEVQMVFDFYAPVLHHYPKMTQVAKLVKQEIQLRINPKYGI